jgi:hypothetical protein
MIEHRARVCGIHAGRNRHPTRIRKAHHRFVLCCDWVALSSFARISPTPAQKWI